MVTGLRLPARWRRRETAVAWCAAMVLAIGIAGTTVVYTIAQALLFQPLPYREIDRLVAITPAVPWDLFEGLRDRCPALEEVAAYTDKAANLSGDGDPERGLVAHVAGDFFAVVGVQPTLGRRFSSRELHEGARVAVLTDGLWRRLFRGSATALGRILVLDDRAYQIVGVLPPGTGTLGSLEAARAAGFEAGAVAFVPLSGSITAGYWIDRETTDRVGRGFRVVARLRRGASLEQAKAEFAVAETATRVVYPDLGPTLIPVREALAPGLPTQLGILMAAVGLLLAVACANVAGILLEHAEGRRREMAVRSALGASRGQLIRHFLGESGILALGGAVGGVAVSWVGLRAVRLAASSVLTGLDDVGMNLHAVAFAALLSLVSGAVVGVVPGIRASRVDPVRELQGQPWVRHSSGGRHGMVQLVVAQVALAVVLVLVGGLLARDLVRLQAEDLGFNPRNVLTLELSLSRARYGDDRSIRFFTELSRRARTLPGVERVALSQVPPQGLVGSSRHVLLSGGREESVYYLEVSGDYFSLLSIPIIWGRSFRDAAQADTQPEVIVNRAFAVKYWRTPENALGARLKVARAWCVVVGVAANAREGPAWRPLSPMLYTNYLNGTGSQQTVLIRTRGDPRAVARPMADLVRRLDPQQPIYNVLTLDQIVAMKFARQRGVTLLMTVFAGLTLLLATVGLYGALAYTVTLRTPEIGIRLALGASPVGVVALVVSHGLRLVALGLLIGVPAALSLRWFVESELVGTSSLDAAICAEAIALVTAAGFASVFVPSLRAARVEPARLFRSH